MFHPHPQLDDAVLFYSKISVEFDTKSCFQFKDVETNLICSTCEASLSDNTLLASLDFKEHPIFCSNCADKEQTGFCRSRTCDFKSFGLLTDDNCRSENDKNNEDREASFHLSWNDGWYTTHGWDFCVLHGEMIQKHFSDDLTRFKHYKDLQFLFDLKNRVHCTRPKNSSYSSHYLEDRIVHCKDMILPPIHRLDVDSAHSLYKFEKISLLLTKQIKEACSTFWLKQRDLSVDNSDRLNDQLIWPWNAGCLVVNEKLTCNMESNLGIGSIRGWIPIDYFDHEDNLDDPFASHGYKLILNMIEPKSGFFLRTYVLVNIDKSNPEIYGKIGTMLSDSHLFAMNSPACPTFETVTNKKETKTDQLAEDCWSCGSQHHTEFASAHSKLRLSEYLDNKYSLLFFINDLKVLSYDLVRLVEQYTGFSTESARRLHLIAPWRSLFYHPRQHEQSTS